jgi:tetratricopeptide (TPR) repeat protein
MNRNQWLAVGGSILLFLLIYFVLDTRPPEQESGPRPAAGAMQATSAEVLIREAAKDLTQGQILELEILEERLAESEEDPEAKVEVLKGLSSRWYAFGKPSIAGHYARRVAEEVQNAEAWGIAGSTFSIGLQKAEEEKELKYCRQNAVTCFENAISLDPDEVSYRLNLALVYTEQPLVDDPMRGILMLRELNQNYPENVPVLNNLGRLGIQTGQIERALERLERSYELDPENPVTVCLLAQAYQAGGSEDKAGLFADKCRDLRN